MQYTGIGPRVQLKTKEAEEPTVEGEDTPADPEVRAARAPLPAGALQRLYACCSTRAGRLSCAGALHPPTRTPPPSARLQEWDGTAVLSGLEAGKSYTLYKFTDPAKVPDSAEAAVDAAGAAWSAAVVATGATQEVPVKFSSGTPAYYIAVAA